MKPITIQVDTNTSLSDLIVALETMCKNISATSIAIRHDELKVFDLDGKMIAVVEMI